MPDPGVTGRNEADVARGREIAAREGISRSDKQSRIGPASGRQRQLRARAAQGITPSLGGRDFVNEFDRLPPAIRALWITQFFEQGGRLFNAVTGGLSDFFSNFDLDEESFDTPEALGPGGDGLGFARRRLMNQQRLGLLNNRFSGNFGQPPNLTSSGLGLPPRINLPRLFG